MPSFSQVCEKNQLLVDLVEEFYGTRYKSDSFSLLMWGVVIHCLRSFLHFFDQAQDWLALLY
jgi:hypothetical protein